MRREEGYRVITTSYVYFRSLDEAVAFARKGRGEGKRTAIIAEAGYKTNPEFHKPMQNLLPFMGDSDAL